MIPVVIAISVTLTIAASVALSIVTVVTIVTGLRHWARFTESSHEEADTESYSQGEDYPAEHFGWSCSCAGRSEVCVENDVIRIVERRYLYTESSLN